MTQSVINRTDPLMNPMHIVILHEKLGKTREDRYIVNIAEALRYCEHSVTIVTSYVDLYDCPPELNTEDQNLKLCLSGTWIPNSLLGFFGDTFRTIKTAWMSMRLVLFPPKPRPEIVILDTHPIALLILGKLSSYTIFYVDHMPLLKDVTSFTSYVKITPSLFALMWLKYAQEIIVQSECLANIFRRSYPNIQKNVKVLCPCVDIGTWTSEPIDINRIIRDLPEEYILFSVFGRYNKRSNFNLALDAFEYLLLLLDENQRSKVYLVIAGHTKTAEEVKCYTEILEVVKSKMYANQVTFLRQMPVIHKKTILSKSTAVLHTAQYEVFPGIIPAAMNLGVPIIATNTGVATTLLTHRITGVLVEPHRPKRFAAAMYKLILKPTLREFIKDMAKDSFRTKYSFEGFSTKLYQMLLKYDGRLLKGMGRGISCQ